MTTRETEKNVFLNYKPSEITSSVGIWDLLEKAGQDIETLEFEEIQTGSGLLCAVFSKIYLCDREALLEREKDAPVS